MHSKIDIWDSQLYLGGSMNILDKGLTAFQPLEVLKGL